MGENRVSANNCKFVQILVVAIVAICLCGCATVDENGQPTYLGEILNGAKETCTVIAGYVVANPEQSANVLEWVGGTLSMLGLGSVGAVFVWGGNKLRKACVKKTTEEEKEPEAKECKKDTLSA